MTVPKPQVTLEGDCSTIHSNTLYVFSRGNFLSIPLRENGTWTELPKGTSVNGPACVQGGSKGDEAFYVVGGTGPAGYDGLQQFSFKDQKWQNLTMSSQVMANRTGHGAGYIASSSQILVYAGMTDGSTVSSQSTLLISTTSPYDVTSGLDQGAPALYEPILLPWSDSKIAMIGGSATNTAVHIYDAEDSKGWTLSEATLPSAIPTNSRCTLVSDSEKNIVLEEFTMNTSPNSVSSYLLSSKGKLQSPATTIGKRSLTDSSYNNTLAPSNSWSNFALAQGENMVVLSNGGGHDSLAIFNQTSNGWVNATELFYGSGDQNVLKPSTTSSITSSTPTATSTTSTSTSATATPSSTSAAAAGGGLSDHAKTILGATLGSVLGFGLILLILLFLIRREKQKKQHQSGKAGGDSKDRLSFQDQGIEPLTEGAYPMARSPVPVAAASTDSLAIMTGRYNGEKSLKPPNATGYGLSHPRKSSPLSTIPSSDAMGASSVNTDETEGGTDPSRGNQPGDRSTDEGWGKYFEDNTTTTNLAGMASDRSTMSSVYTKSDYRGSAWPMSNLTPLNLGFLDQPKPLGRVMSASPTTENTSEIGGRSLVIPESQSARISSADSISIASESDRDENWQGAGHSSWLGRPSSSNYSNSFYNSSTRDLPGTSSYTGLVDKTRNSKVRRSSAIIPEDMDELPMQGRSNNVNSDMSWLNLQADR
jgi:hypothetical protein